MLKDADGNKKSWCLAGIDSDRRCAYKEKTYNSANFKRHILECHSDVAHRLGDEKSDREKRAQSNPERVQRF